MRKYKQTCVPYDMQVDRTELHDLAARVVDWGLVLPKLLQAWEIDSADPSIPVSARPALPQQHQSRGDGGGGKRGSGH